MDGRRDWSFGRFDCTHECGLCMSLSLVELSFNMNHALWQVAVSSSVPAWSLLNKQRLYHLQNSGTPFPRGNERFDPDCSIYLPGPPWPHLGVVGMPTRRLSVSRVTQRAFRLETERRSSQYNIRGVRGRLSYDSVLPFLFVHVHAGAPRN